jgi:diguanylate cyclase (GGDEF)-like protein
MVDEHSVTDNARSVGRIRVPPVAFAIVEVLLLSAALLVAFPVGGLCNMLAMLVGLLVITTQVVRVRPRPLWAWSLVVGTGWTLVAGAVVASVSYGLRGGINIHDPPSLLLAAAPFLILGAALGLFARVAPRRGPADTLDALIAALAVFLLLWTVWLGPAFSVDVVPAIIATILPLSLLVAVTMGVKLVLGGGAQDTPVALVLLGGAALAGASIDLLVPGVGRANLPISPGVNLLWASFGAAIGAAALHHGLGRARMRRKRAVNDASVFRTVLFALLALVPLVIWANEATRGSSPARQAMAIAVSAVLLVLLVIRMAMVSRIAHRRAAQLARRSSALAAAVSQQRELQSELAFRAAHDPLTRLSNRTVLAEHMQRALAGPGTHSLLLFDLDRFKDVNDTSGHPVGDHLLIAVADRLQRAAPHGAVLARLGGDEFALFLENTGEADATAEAIDLLDRLRPPFLVDGHEFLITASGGVLTTDRSGPSATPTQALSDADLALYRAKELGKDRIETFRPELRYDRVDHARITAGLRQALDHDELGLRYQPVIELSSGNIVAVEALLRWHGTDGAVMSPDDFLPVAEDAGLIGQIGAWVLRQACRDVRPWHTQRGVSVFVNVAGRQLDHPEFAMTVVKAIADAGLPNEAVVLEITEGSLLTTSPVDVRFQQLRMLHDHNVRLAIDDFGTGYSSLSYVAQLPIDIVKIDRSLIQVIDDGPTSGRSWAFTRAVVDLVNSLDLTAIAEGVETAEQARALRATRCPLAQGFHLCRPLGAPDIDALLGLTARAAGPAPARATGRGL